MKIAHILIFVFAISALPAVTLAESEDFQARCKQWAVEDGVAADELQSYIASCMKDAASDQEEEVARVDAERINEEPMPNNQEETPETPENPEMQDSETPNQAVE